MPSREPGTTSPTETTPAGSSPNMQTPSNFRPPPISSMRLAELQAEVAGGRLESMLLALRFEKLAGETRGTKRHLDQQTQAQIMGMSEDFIEAEAQLRAQRMTTTYLARSDRAHSGPGRGRGRGLRGARGLA